MKRTVILVTAFLLMACSSFNLTKFFSLKSDTATATVGDKGAELTLKDDAQLLINPGGVKAGSEVTFSVMDVSKWDNPIPEGLEINKIYTVEASEWTDDLEANLTLPLDLKDVPPAEWDNYGIAYFSEGQWVQVPSSIDPQKGISATVNHFSIFTLFKRIFNPAPKVMVNVSPDKYDNKPADKAQPGQLEDLQVDVSAYDPKGERLTVLVTFGYKSVASEAGYDILGERLAVATGDVKSTLCTSNLIDVLSFNPSTAPACILAVALAEGIKPPTKNVSLDQYWYRMEEIEPGHFSLTASHPAIELDSYLTKVYVFIKVYDSLKDAPVEKTVEIPVVAYQISDAPEPASPGPSAEVVCPPSPVFRWTWSGSSQSSGSYRFRLVHGDNLWGSWFYTQWTCDDPGAEEGQCEKGGPDRYLADHWSPPKPLAEGVYTWGFKASDKNGESDFDDSTISSSKIYQFRVDKTLSGSECQIPSPNAPDQQVAAVENTPVPAAQDEYGCDNPSLTPEEKANCGKHSYSAGPCQDIAGDFGPHCFCFEANLEYVSWMFKEVIIFQFNSENLIGLPKPFTKIKNITYINKDDELYCFDSGNKKVTHPPMYEYIEFLKDGFTYTYEQPPYEIPDCAGYGSPPVGTRFKGCTAEIIFTRDN